MQLSSWLMNKDFKEAIWPPFLLSVITKSTINLITKVSLLCAYEVIKRHNKAMFMSVHCENNKSLKALYINSFKGFTLR